MRLTKKELADTQVIVTTPEKWDVTTRKTGDVALVQMVISVLIHLFGLRTLLYGYFLMVGLHFLPLISSVPPSCAKCVGFSLLCVGQTSHH